VLKILSWNIQQGGGRRVIPIIQALIDFKPHIIVLSEFRNNKSGTLIKSHLAKAKYNYQFVTEASPNQNSVFIASMIEGQPRYFRDYDEHFRDNIIALDFDAFSLYGMYLPHKKKHILFDLLIEESQKEHPSIMVGDFNTGKNFIDQKKSSFWYTEKLEKMESLGMKDAFRHMHGDDRQYSWYSHGGNGYRYDHTYISQELLPVISECYYLHEWREKGLSDHSPMLLSL